MKRIHFTRQFNWRMLLVRIVVNALALLAITILPDIHFVDPTVLRILFVALILGVLNSLVKPIIQFLTLQFIFITYGFAVVVINAIMLLLLNIVVPNMFAVESLIWALIGGAMLGLVSGFFESLLGLQIPIMPEATTLLPTPAEGPSAAIGSRLFRDVIGQNEELADEQLLEAGTTGPDPNEENQEGDADSPEMAEVETNDAEANTETREEGV